MVKTGYVPGVFVKGTTFQLLKISLVKGHTSVFL